RDFDGPSEYYDSEYCETESESSDSEFSDSEAEFGFSHSEAVNVPLTIQDNSRASFEIHNIAKKEWVIIYHNSEVIILFQNGAQKIQQRSRIETVEEAYQTKTTSCTIS
ncbi:15605_t:CDS:2, partial [Acaulospora colombiana]